MEHLSPHALRIARLVTAIVFILNATGVIDQAIPEKEMMERGVPAVIVPWFMLAGLALEFVAGLALAFCFSQRLAALALLAFVIAATLVSHASWLSAGTPAFMGQLINFSKTFAICVGLPLVGAAAIRPALMGSK